MSLIETFTGTVKQIDPNHDGSYVVHYESQAPLLPLGRKTPSVRSFQTAADLSPEQTKAVKNSVGKAVSVNTLGPAGPIVSIVIDGLQIK